MKKILCCKACEARLTSALTLVSSKAPGIIPPEQEEGKPLTPRGTVFKSWEPIERSHGDQTALLEFAPQYWLKPGGHWRDRPQHARSASSQRLLWA